MLKYKTAQLLFKALSAQHMWMAECLRTSGEKITVDKKFIEARLVEAQNGLTDFLTAAEEELRDNGNES